MIRQGYKGHLSNNSVSDLSAVPTISSGKESRGCPAKAIESLFAGGWIDDPRHRHLGVYFKQHFSVDVFQSAFFCDSN